MTPSWLTPPTGPAADIAARCTAMVPELLTSRLILRAPRIADFPAYRAVFVSDRSRYMGGPFSEDDAFGDFCQGIAGWMLRGAGMWTLTLRDHDTPLGWVYLWQEQGDAEPELGWVLTEAAEGYGYASEAARTVLPHAVRLYRPQGFVSYINAENHRSARLAIALGATRDAAAEARLTEPDLHVYRHSGTGAAA